MKRSDALAPLSRDHHAALVVARSLSRAGGEGTAAGGDTARRFVEFLAGHELAHFAVEEAVLLPLLPAGRPGDELARRLLDDHAYLRAAMRRLSADPQAASVEYLHEVGTRLRDHVQMEERELFPYLEESLAPEVLDEVGIRLAEHD